MGRLLRRLDTAQILDTLSVVAGQKRPLAEGIAVAGPHVSQERRPPAALSGDDRRPNRAAIGARASAVTA